MYGHESDLKSVITGKKKEGNLSREKKKKTQRNKQKNKRKCAIRVYVCGVNPQKAKYELNLIWKMQKSFQLTVKSWSHPRQSLK